MVNIRSLERTRGQIAVPLLLFFIVALSAGFGAWGPMRLQFRLAQRQVELDSCVGRKAIELRDLLRSIDTSNARIVALRASITAASLQPELIPPLQRWLEAEVAGQELKLATWRVGAVAWRLGAGCSPRQAVLPANLPEPALYRPTPDPIGARPLEWREGEPERLRVIAVGLRRSAAAEVRSRKNAGILEEKWTAHWTTLNTADPPSIDRGRRFLRQ